MQACVQVICADMCIDTCTGMCADMCIGLCADMCTGTCTDRCADHVYKHTYRSCVQTCVQTCVRVCVPTCVQTHVQTRVPACAQACVQALQMRIPRGVMGCGGQISTRGRTRAPEEGTRGWNGAMRQLGEYRVRKGRRERQCVVTERACELAADRVQVCLWK